MVFDVDVVDFVVVFLLGSAHRVAMLVHSRLVRHVDLQLIRRLVHQLVEVGPVPRWPLTLVVVVPVSVFRLDFQQMRAVLSRMRRFLAIGAATTGVWFLITDAAVVLGRVLFVFEI